MAKQLSQQSAEQWRQRVAQWLKDQDYGAAIFMDADPHLGEYCHPQWRLRSAMSTFPSSAGLLVVGHQASGLWVDARYWQEATEQLPSQEMAIYCSDQQPSWKQWCREHCKRGATVLCNGQVISYWHYEQWQRLLADSQLQLESKPSFYHLSYLWLGNQKSDADIAPYFELSSKLCGRSRQSKIEGMRHALQKAGADTVLLSDLDDIAWLLNLRGWDIPYSQTLRAFLILTLSQGMLFANRAACGTVLLQQLEREKIEVYDYANFEEQSQKLINGTLMMDPRRTSHAIFSHYRNYGATQKRENEHASALRIQSPLWPTLTKMRKTAAELEGIRRCGIQEGVVYATFNFRLQQELQRGVVTERRATQLLQEIRQARPHYLQESFAPIVAHNAHAALIHYGQSSRSEHRIEGGILLVDSGAHYDCGTTDITRVLALAPPTAQLCRDYTMVLRAHIALAEATLPPGVTARQIDTVARAILWRVGDDYQHGTGHGIGFVLNVHEGPLALSPLADPLELQVGMVMSNEPGIYRPSHYGIRIENMMVVQSLQSLSRAAPRNVKGASATTLLGFEILSPCHLEPTLVDAALLDEGEKRWYNSYQSWVGRSLVEHLPPEIATWLEKITAPLK